MDGRAGSTGEEVGGDPSTGEREAVEPDISMQAAAEVVEAMAVAEIGRGWLWVPS